mmetsp:Transcript_119398/g.166580  ORF Transcript_119398/g.166580 Transcript_119398/m.166580 type:complete len:235 (-) Transcript_119398:970-1674(-)
MIIGKNIFLPKDNSRFYHFLCLIIIGKFVFLSLLCSSLFFFALLLLFFLALLAFLLVGFLSTRFHDLNHSLVFFWINFNIENFPSLFFISRQIFIVNPITFATIRLPIILVFRFLFFFFFVILILILFFLSFLFFLFFLFEVLFLFVFIHIFHLCFFLFFLFLGLFLFLFLLFLFLLLFALFFLLDFFKDCDLLVVRYHVSQILSKQFESSHVSRFACIFILIIFFCNWFTIWS